MDLDKLIRKLAKSLYYQTIYSQEKNLGLKLFKNDYNFTALQIRFLGDLAFYNSLYLEYNLGEIDERVFDNEIYEDSYMYYKNKKERPHSQITKIREQIPPLVDKKPTKNISSWVFKSKKVNK